MSQARRAWLLFVLAPVFYLHVRLGSAGRQRCRPFPAQQRPALRAALGQRVELGQDPRLVRRGERPALRPLWLAAAHLTIMPRDRGLVSECHRHCLGSPVSPCSTSKGLIRPWYHSSYKNRYRDERHLARYDDNTIERLGLAA